jgi:hypothetical protein
MEKLCIGWITQFVFLIALAWPVAAREPTSKGMASQVSSSVTPAGLRQAIEGMNSEFGDRYPKGNDLLARLDAIEKTRPQDNQALEELARNAYIANPLICAYPILFVTRNQYRPDHHNTETLFQTGEINTGSYQPGGPMKAIDFSQDGRITELLSPGKEGLLRDPEVSFDGKAIVFSMRKSQHDNYHIYTLVSDGSALRKLTGAPGVSDIDPLFVPDGGIVFSSSREPKYCMCNRHIMANLFRMEADGANIQQIGKSTLFEGHSTLLPDGRVLYDRWEYVDRNFGDAQALWTMNPDGTSHAIYWGNNTASPGGVIDARSIPGTQTILCIMAACHDRPWGALAMIDRNKGIDGPEPVLRTWPESFKSKITVKGQDFDSPRSLSLKYEDPYPLSDKVFLVSRQISGNSERMGIYVVDSFGNEVLLHQEPALGCFDPMPLGPRFKPPASASAVDYTKNTGVFYLQNVYDGTHMQNVNPGEIKYLRIVESPEKRNWSRGGWNGQGQHAPGMNWSNFENKRILGTVPVEPDGSAHFEVPADKFIFFQALDKDGQMVQTMRSGTMIRPGEIQSCAGCHDNRLAAPSAQSANLQAIRRPASPLNGWHGETELFSYMKQVQPIFDKHCVACHDFGKAAGEKLNLAGDRNNAFNTSYIDLWSKRYIHCIGAGPAELQPAKSWGARKSKLIDVLKDGHQNITLSPDEMDALITWIDINGPYYPVYESAYPVNPCGRSPLTKAEYKQLEEITGAAFAEGRNFKGTDSLSFDRPEISPCLDNLDKDSAVYKQALDIIRTGQQRLKEKPRGDVEEGFTPCLADQKRLEKYQERVKTEETVRKAILSGRKLYDPDL